MMQAPKLKSHAQTRITTLMGLSVIGLMCASVSQAQTSQSTVAAFEKGYGMARGQFEQSVNPSTRDANGNRLLLDGMIMLGSDQSVYAFSKTYGAGDSYSGAGAQGGATAIGNLLNVTVNGNYNTVVVNSTQTNTGTVTATSNGVTETGTTGVLNGTINLGN